MATVDLTETARALVAGGKGILAADETPGTLTKRFEALHIESTAEARRQYREMLFATPGISRFVSGVILQDETIRQRSSAGVPFAELLAQQGTIPGIKVDTGAKRLAGTQETITEGLDGLRDRLKNYGQMGARFAKWRAVIRIGDGIPTRTCVIANAHALGRYAALCQEQGLVPIVEPEVLMDGSHTIEHCEEVTGDVLQATFDSLFEQHIRIEGMLLKPNMVIAGKECRQRAPIDEVATNTLRCLRRHSPAAVPGVVFLSGGQNQLAATQHLNAINKASGPKPWKLTFSYGRALQDEALRIWNGNSENDGAARQAFIHRAACVSAAALGQYSPDMESELAA
jgi:fructose-bisphosphate aldolase, class I